MKPKETSLAIIPEEPHLAVALKDVQYCFSKGKFTLGLQIASQAILQEWSAETIDQRLKFADDAQALLPDNRKEELAFSNLRETAHWGFSVSVENSKSIIGAISIAAILALIIHLSEQRDKEK